MMMMKQIIALLILSIVIILGMPYAQQGLQFLVNSHDWIAEQLKQVFSVGEAGNLVRQLLALLAMPVVVGFVPALIFWLVKRSWFPYLMELIWVIWLVQTSALIIIYKAAA
ncbi:MAG: hypothetical protein ABI597_06920 [Gammaproteobacteria bacterium]